MQATFTLMLARFPTPIAQLAMIHAKKDVSVQRAGESRRNRRKKSESRD